MALQLSLFVLGTLQSNCSDQEEKFEEHEGNHADNFSGTSASAKPSSVHDRERGDLVMFGVLCVTDHRGPYMANKQYKH